MIKWKCVLCYAEMRSETRPALGQRLCPDDLVKHWDRVVDIYKGTDNNERLAEAKQELIAAKSALKRYRGRVNV